MRDWNFLTDVTISSVGGVVSGVGCVIDRSSGLSWMQQADLARVLADLLPHLDVPACRILVSEAQSGMPVVVTWESRGPGDSVEVRRVTAIIDRLVFPSITREGRAQPQLPGRMYVRYTGFSHDLYLDRVTAVAMPDNGAVFVSPDVSKTYAAEARAW